MIKKPLSFIKKYFFEILLLLLGFSFSWWLMFSTFSYKAGNILVAGKAWSDFGSHLPLIRSFSLGINFPPEYPLFAGEPIHYHFMFYAISGTLERFGLNISYALNIPSTLGFFCLLVMLYVFAKALFHSRFVGILSAIFFLFNGTLSFLYFLKNHPINNTFLQSITTNSTFSSFHPYGPGLVSAFWNLNIYTNQRHLAGSFAFSLFILYWFLRPVLQKGSRESVGLSVCLGIALGLSYYFHIAVFAMTAITILLLSILFRKIRGSGIIILLITGLLYLPQNAYMNNTSQAFKTIISLGYLTPSPLTLSSFVNYWALNLGLHMILIPIGFVLASYTNKKVFLAFFAFFVIGNVFQFSPEMAANHKFFNYFMLIGNMYSAYVIFLMLKKGFYVKLTAVILLFFLVFSGIVDFFPIHNDSKIEIRDYPINADMRWVKENTPSQSIFLNTQYFVPIESLAGRRIFLGWPYFSWSQGYDTTGRSEMLAQLFQNSNRDTICAFLIKHNISYISVVENPTDYPFDKKWFEDNFQLSYENSDTKLVIYATQNNCN